ncbi:MAG: sulfatase-like hydrolase/transferase [Gemmataceae bacterium]|nr:sulfatase-like hydrolase/transferase [Gemmata sp.]MDW8199229.1 sulfatase-like hydrolase/transferase [Gemmataceae bacterium]
MRVILFAIHGGPAGWLGTYGNDWVGTPHLDRLASEGVVFDRHISDCPEPAAARRAWLRDGPHRFPCPTFLIRANHPDTDLPDEYYAHWSEVFDARPQTDDSSPLEELLRRFPTWLDRLANIPDLLLVIEIDRLLPPWDVPAEVFEAYLHDEPETSAETEKHHKETEATNEERDSPEAAAAESAAADEPVPPWADPPIGFFDPKDLDAWDYLHRSFAAVVTKLDAELGQLFDELRRKGFDQSAVWIVTSDWGLPLGEHGQVGLYRPWLHEELVHLPLIVRLPGAEQCGRRVAGFTQPPDLYPTLLALLGSTPTSDDNSFNLLPLLRGEAASLRPYAVTALEVGGAAECALRTDEWALLVPTRVPEGDPPRAPMLFEKPDDRWEVNDLRPRNIERADELEAQLRQALQ